MDKNDPRVRGWDRIVSYDPNPTVESAVAREAGEGYWKMIGFMSDGSEVVLFSWYDDELSFSTYEVVGMTAKAAEKLHFDKDQAYLQA